MKKILTSALILLSTCQIYAQLVKPVKWSYAAKRTSSTEATVYINASIDDGWHIYSVNQKEGGPEKTELTFSISKSYVLLGKVVEPKPIKKYEEVFGMDVFYFEHSVVFAQKIKLKAKQLMVKGKVSFMACTNKQCLPPDEVEFSIPIR
jgi:hypothetical protein